MNGIPREAPGLHYWPFLFWLSHYWG